MNLPPYEEYKDSGVDWLGRVPEHWQIRRVRRLCQIRKRIIGTLGYDVLSITQQGIKIKDLESNDGQLSMDYSKYQLVEVGDFAMNHMDLLTGYVDISHYQGVTSPDYRVFAVHDHSNCDDKYLLHLFQMGYKNKIFFAYGQGSSQLGRWRLPSEQFKDLSFPLPPKDEQQAIVAFLERETARIDDLIAKQERLIELSMERRRALINQAVTRGIDSSVALKDSGIEWLGKVPQHWEVKPLKHSVAYQEGPGIMATDFKDEGIPLLRISCISSNIATLDGCNFLSPELVARKWGHFRTEIGDLLISGSASTGLCAEVNNVTAGAIPYTGIIILRPKESTVERGYIRWFFLSNAFEVQVKLMQTGSTIQHFGPSHLSTVVMALPPRKEQIKIIDFINHETEKIRLLIEKARKAIDLMKEHRASLIAAAVTGKIDVRGC